jgi:hypothetical protein
MSVPINCPICNDPLLNDFREGFGDKHVVLIKSCSKRIDHQYSCHINNQEMVYLISITLKFGQFFWNFNHNLFWMTKVRGGSKSLTLPWFVPDFTDRYRLFKKLKTYVVFS